MAFIQHFIRATSRNHTHTDTESIVAATATLGTQFLKTSETNEILQPLSPPPPYHPRTYAYMHHRSLSLIRSHILTPTTMTTTTTTMTRTLTYHVQY